MKSVRGLVSDLLKDVRPGKWTEPPKQAAQQSKPPAPKQEARTHQNTSGPVRVYRKDHIEVPHAQTAPTVLHTTQSGPTEPLDPNCQHKPSYKDGVKFCWLCGGAYPLDERPPSPWGQQFRKR